MIVPILLAAAMPASACTVTDGDTIKCRGERIRLLGIDAPEIHGCRKGRVCVLGDGQASKLALERMMRGKVRIDRVGRDRYGRSLSHVYAGRENVACRLVKKGLATYQRAWDNGRRLARECGF
ncbi:MAG: thermonuclease family protein [Sphingobium sp.]